MNAQGDIGPDLVLEQTHWQCGHLVAGADETGRGALAGPLVAAAVILHPGMHQTGFWRDVHDSKRLSRSRRERLFQDLEHHIRHHAFGTVSAREIDALGIEHANRTALERAIRGLPEDVDVVLVDWVRAWPLNLGTQCQQLRFVRGDARHLSIATASVLAKVYKDRCMSELDRRFPAYGFGANSGYLTRQHTAALGELGPCPEHRYSFRPLATHYVRPTL